ncbi:C2 calcium-dependent membrane targeting [Macleaya cordata]|uniref:C2 calcium-dependent membrane targeting n=1 Tax=Macleaya cordata TaxID=56857 RepID=A0A200QXI5_MACCD|nr:C2 calcium-dependent membrane targeting [Macleaya cordata]
MDTHQSVVSPFKNSSPVSELESQKSGFVNQNSGSLSEEIGMHSRKEAMVRNSDEFIGVLEVYIHEARDIHNICIYQKQDVYAKVYLTSNPENTVSTQIINGGGRNPVFNECLKLKVGTIESSIKCEIWMLSRVKNYLEDQLLGFALVPLSEILIGNGRLAQEFILSSSDLFHSPAGLVQLSLSYSGASPEVMPIPDPRQSVAANKALQDSEVSDSIASDYDKIEFPDPQIVNENHQMVSEYYSIQCTNLDNHSSESLGTLDTENHDSSESSDIGVRVVENSSIANSVDSITAPKIDTPASSVSTTGSPSASISVSSQSICDTPGASKSPNSEFVSPFKEKNVDVARTETESSGGVPSKTFAQSVLKVNIEPEQTVVQQDIVDMYMKSMQQFTESLAKMKLPLDIENGNSSGKDNSSSDQKLQGSKATGSRVFYGSRAFF